MTIKDQTFAGLSKKEFQLDEGQWIINVDKPTICIFNVSWIKDKINYQRLSEDQRDWDIIKVNCSNSGELIAKYGLSTFPSYVCLQKNRPPRLISAYISETELISFMDYFLS